MPRLKELLIELGQELSSLHSTESEKEEFRELITVAVMNSGWMSALKTSVNIGVRVKSKTESRQVSKAEVLADLVNDLLMSGEVNGIEFCRLVDKSHL